MIPVKVHAVQRLIADWWSAMSPQQQERYLKKHPRSSRNKQGKSEDVSKPVVKKKPVAQKPTPSPAPVANKVAKGKRAHKAAQVELNPQEVDALKEYTGSMYQSVNKQLRAGKPVSKADRKEVKLVDDAFSKAKTAEPIEVYRGISGEFYSKLKPGETFKDHAFVSTSADIDTADNFARGEHKALMKVQVPKGSKAISVDSLSVFKKGGAAVRSENEILLNRGGSYKVVSIKPARPGQPQIITVEYSDG